MAEAFVYFSNKYHKLNSFSRVKTQNLRNDNGKATLEVRKKGQYVDGVKKREFVLEDELPLEYNIGVPGALSAPDLLCHLSNPETRQYHVTRYII